MDVSHHLTDIIQFNLGALGDTPICLLIEQMFLSYSKSNSSDLIVPIRASMSSDPAGTRTRVPSVKGTGPNR